MLTQPDFTKKKILYISHKEGFVTDIRFRNSNIAIYRESEKVNQISCHLVFSIFIIGNFTITSELIRNAQKFGISIFMLNHLLQVYSVINANAEGNYHLHQIQYSTTKEASLLIAKKIVRNKIKNQQHILDLYEKQTDILPIIAKSDKSKDIQSLLGFEGEAAKIYFKNVFSSCMWYRRAPRTKEDVPNLLLDIGYTFTFNYVDALLRLFGFDTYKGNYHQLFFQRKSLSCDVMEAIRPIIDKELVKSYNLGIVDEKDFKFKDGSYYFATGVDKKYVGIWFDLLMKYRDEVYKYIFDYYHYVLNSQKYKFPYFKIK